MKSTFSHTISLPIRRLNKPNSISMDNGARHQTRPTISPINETAIVDIPEADDRDVEMLSSLPVALLMTAIEQK